MTTTEFRPHSLVEAADKAREYEPGTPERYYWNGVTLAFLAEHGQFVDEFHDLVNADWLAQPLPFGQAVNLASLRGLLQDENRENHPGRLPRFLNTAGALWGWKEATAHRDDADECTSCDRRILTSSEEFVECPDHGIMHPDCQSGMCDRSCAPEPEFDKDAYYSAKYGDER